MLEKAGLKVADETIKQASNTVENGKVIKTEPDTGRTIKKGTTIKIVVSTGINTITLEDYKGKNYYEIKAQLEEKGLVVYTEKITVEDDEGLTESTIVDQNPGASTSLSEGESITLYLPDLYIEYPDFVKEKWTVAEIEEFCSEHGITLSKSYIETEESPEGTVLTQSRSAGTKVVAGVTLKITIAQAPLVIDPTDGEEYTE